MKAVEGSKIIQRLPVNGSKPKALERDVTEMDPALRLMLQEKERAVMTLQETVEVYSKRLLSKLSEGKRWHSSHLTRVPDAAVIPADQRTQAADAAVMPTGQPLAGTSQPCTPERTMHDRVHPARDRKPPDWLKDYDTGDARTRDSTPDMSL
ncbi:unnamed protein product [Boreogadus saida]